MHDAVQHPRAEPSGATKSAVAHPDGTLREQARALLNSGRLPKSLPKRGWGGPGTGDPCSVCRAAVLESEVGIELELASGNGAGAKTALHFHVRCLSALEY